MPTRANSAVPPPRGWDEFEDIVLSAARIRWKSAEFFRHGRQGQQQDGVDIFGHDASGRTIGVQCKNTRRRLTSPIIDGEIRKAESFSPTISRLFIATTAGRDASMQRYARDLTAERKSHGLFGVYILFWEDIWHHISSDDHVTRQHFPEFAPPRTHRRGSKRDWSWTSTIGSKLSLSRGTAGTTRDPRHFPVATFPSDSTVILGAANRALMESLTDTSAEWHIPFDESTLKAFRRAYLIVAAIRYFGGLHSKVYDSKAKIKLNGNVIDYFGLRDQPPHHSDYFHRLRLPRIPLPRQIAECQTVYVWPLLKNTLVHSPKQTVTISIDKYIRWDIDYIGILVRTSPSH